MHISQQNFNAARAAQHASALTQAFVLGFEDTFLTNPYSFDTQQDLWREFERGAKEKACLRLS